MKPEKPTIKEQMEALKLRLEHNKGLIIQAEKKLTKSRELLNSQKK